MTEGLILLRNAYIIYVTESNVVVRAIAILYLIYSISLYICFKYYKNFLLSLRVP
ncbi:hypothetical protein NIES4103_64090 [Nostoc sp. NIES-4103]|nr:hypothetical protein NIES4103_64090 [Nostoc sp. NIES-4103]